MSKSKKLYFLKIIPSLGLLGWYCYQTDLLQVIKIMSEIPSPPFVLVIGIYFFSLLINAVKWKLLLKDHPIRHLFSLTLVSIYYSLVLPGQLVGEFIKVYKLGKNNINAEKIAASVIIDKITGFLGLISVALIGLIWSKSIYAKEFKPWALVSFFICILSLYAFYFQKFKYLIKKIILAAKNCLPRLEKIIDQLIRLTDAWTQYLKTPVVLLKSILLGVTFQLLSIFITMILSMALDIDVSFTDWCWIFGVISIIVFLPISIGGLGLREGGFILLLGQLGVSDEKALALSLSLFALQVIGAIAGCIIEFRPHRL